MLHREDAFLANPRHQKTSNYWSRYQSYHRDQMVYSEEAVKDRCFYVLISRTQGRLVSYRVIAVVALGRVLSLSCLVGLRICRCGSPIRAVQGFAAVALECVNSLGLKFTVCVFRFGVLNSCIGLGSGFHGQTQHPDKPQEKKH